MSASPTRSALYSGSRSLLTFSRLIKRAAIIGRLFYHTAMVLLHQINPLERPDSVENEEALQHHARQVCGIVAHTKDRGVASVAIRSMAISASVLKDRREQDEVMAIFFKINKETGWRLGKVHSELQRAWGWTTAPSLSASAGLGKHTAPPPPMQTQQQRQQQQQQYAAASSGGDTFGPTVTTASASVPLLAPVPRAIVNPLLANSDFSNKNHPYNLFYRPPNQANATRDSQHLWLA